MSRSVWSQRRNSLLTCAGAVVAFATASAHVAAPQNAIEFIVAASERYPVVELGRTEGTGNASEMDLIAQLLADRRFTANVDDVVIEAGNSRYQAMLDRYVSGQYVPPQQLAVVWRKTTQIIGGEADPTTKMLIDMVRDFNLTRPPHQLRVLAADPPIDWDAIHTAAQFEAFSSQRDTNAASVIEKQVLSKHRRVLVVMGGAHFTKWATPQYGPTVTMLLERHSPGSTYVIYTIVDVSRFDANLRRTFASWPAPVIVPIAGTELALQSGRTITAPDTMHRVGSRWVPVTNAYPGHTLGQLFDAVLYLGPANKLRTIELKEPTDEPYATELKRIRSIAIGTPSPR
jgi:hypothetical protein